MLYLRIVSSSIMWHLNLTREGLGGYFVIWMPFSCATSWNTGRKNFKRLDGRCSPCKLPYWMEVISLENERYPQVWPLLDTMERVAPFSALTRSFTLKRKWNLWWFLLYRSLTESLMRWGSWYSEAEITNDNWLWERSFNIWMNEFACSSLMNRASGAWAELSLWGTKLFHRWDLMCFHCSIHFVAALYGNLLVSLLFPSSRLRVQLALISPKISCIGFVHCDDVHCVLRFRLK